MEIRENEEDRNNPYRQEKIRTKPSMLLNAPEQPRTWVEKSLAYVSSLPAKAKKASGRGRGSKSPKK